MSLPLHHFTHTHIKEKEKKYFEKIHSKKGMKQYDRFMIFIGIASPLMTIPQILEIWLNKDAGRVSLITWSIYILSAICWLIYGIIHKSKPLIITEIAWIIVESIVLAGIIIY